MAGQPFDRLLEGEPQLLASTEALVVDAHRRWYASEGRAGWSAPAAYRWLRYEDPDPVARLREGVRRLPVDYDEGALSVLERRAVELGR